MWHLYVIRTVDDHLYAGISTDVNRRFEEHLSGGPKSAKFFRAHPPDSLAFAVDIGSRSLATKVEYWFKRLDRARKELVLRSTLFHFDETTGKIIINE